ncbi:hypothetical protein Barb6XT_01317 [Bacteroidales bacterium Barb6XT]|nr:hypothetical protein Barb6XT_01317 [Bacteroidales bacterium Barb6XT]
MYLSDDKQSGGLLERSTLLAGGVWEGCRNLMGVNIELTLKEKGILVEDALFNI